jgi:CHAT domain-containing protein/Tfp pilus assembly protein PilF
MFLVGASGRMAFAQAPDAKLIEARTELNSARKLKKQGDYQPALNLAKHALALREAELGKTHPEVAAALELVGDIHLRQRELVQAEFAIQRALAIRESPFGLDDPKVATSLTQLAKVHMARGSYKQAELLLKRALHIQETAFGLNHRHVSTSLDRLANLYVAQGMYDLAEPLYLRALAIREKELGQNHPTVATVLCHLSILYRHQRFYGRADSLGLRALKIRQGAPGAKHPDLASSLNQLAFFYFHQGFYDRAEPLYRDALSLRRDVFGQKHPLYAKALNNLANLYRRQGLYDRAEPLYRDAIAILEAALGANRHDVATPLKNLANLYAARGLYSRAEPLYQRALTLREEVLGSDHPGVAPVLLALGRLRLAQHRLDEALPLYTRAFSIVEQRLRQEALGFSEPRLTHLLRSLHSYARSIYALLRAHPKDARVQRLALSAALLLKGRTSEEMARLSLLLHHGMSAEDRDAFELLRVRRTQLATLSLKGPSGLSPEDYQQKRKQLSEEGDAREEQLARNSAPLRALTQLPQPDDIVERVAASLPTDGALVEFIAYRNGTQYSTPGTPLAKRDGILHYLALVLWPDASIRTVDLGLAAPIDTAASKLHEELSNKYMDVEAKAQHLYHLAFEPLLPLLGSTRRVVLSPDGLLGLVPFAALHDGRRFLVDSFNFTYLTSGRELLPRPQKPAPATSVIVFAFPDFSANIPSEPPGSKTKALERFWSRSVPTPDPPLGPWPPLPGTLEEAEDIQRRLPQARLFLGDKATKQSLLALSTPGILHLSTHGFGPSTTPFPLQDEPLLNSGLVLAGASTSRAEDSLVTALELAGLDLWGTQLVVLSACESGQGQARVEQGIYGMRRALMVAGAETVIASLWKVNDTSTQQFMDDYYRHLLKGEGRASALREALRSLRATHPHPYFWASFIALGRDAPLRGITPTSP